MTGVAVEPTAAATVDDFVYVVVPEILTFWAKEVMQDFDHRSFSSARAIG